VTHERDPWAGPAGQRFADDHYRSINGIVRTQVVDRQLREHLDAAPAPIVDVGGGAATQSLPLARRGHRVTIIDPSAAMLARARKALAREPARVAERVRLVEAPGEHALDVVGDQRFSGALCHGVVPYLDDPTTLVAVLCALVRPGGIVSLVAKNRAALALRPALERRWSDALAALDARYETNRLGLHTRADTVDDLTRRLAGNHVAREAWYGVRLFVECQPLDWHPAADEVTALLDVEFEASRRDPYRQLSRLFHLIGRRTASRSGTDVAGNVD
jgi:SAM-dependent methyltransferase